MGRRVGERKGGSDEVHGGVMEEVSKTRLQQQSKMGNLYQRN